MAKYANLSQVQNIANGVIAKVKAKGYAVASELGDLASLDEVSKSNLSSDLADEIDGKLDEADLLSYTIKKQAVAETGYASTYQLFSVDASSTETAIGAKINIPKDMVVESGEVKTVDTADVPYTGAVVGDKYIELTIANASQNKLYIPVKDLVDVYTAGNGLSLLNGAFTVVIDGTNANGLSVGASGVALATAVASTGGSGGSAGAMSASDKEKLDSIETATTSDITDIINGLDSLDD